MHWPAHDYAGPGTDITYQIDHLVKPIDRDDAISMVHDVAYSQAGSYSDISQADSVYSQNMRANQIGDLDPLAMTNIHGNMFAKIMDTKQYFNGFMEFIGKKPDSAIIDINKFEKLVNQYQNSTLDPLSTQHIKNMGKQEVLNKLVDQQYISILPSQLKPNPYTVTNIR